MLGARVGLSAVVVVGVASLVGCNLGAPKATFEGPAQAIEATDLNGDSRTDVVSVGAATISILQATPDGTFDQTTIDTGNPFSTFTEVETLDADGDGDDDLVVLEALDNPSVEFLYLLENLGGGQFGDPHSVADYVSAADVSAGDITGDGLGDLVLFDEFDPGQSILVGDGAGGFSPLDPAPNISGRSGEVTDIDGDGQNEVLVATRSHAAPARSTVEIHRVSGGVWLPPVVLATDVGLTANSLAVADVDGDGHADVITANGGSAPATPGSVSVLLGHGDGTFAAPVVTPGVPRLDGDNEIGAGDIDQDGHLDVVVAHQGGVRVLFGDGAGGLSDPHVLDATGGWASDVEVFDSDGDGVDDVVSAGARVDVFVNRLGGARTHP